MRSKVEYQVWDMGELHSTHKRREAAVREANKQAKRSHEPNSVHVSRTADVTKEGDHV